MYIVYNPGACTTRAQHGTSDRAAARSLCTVDKAAHLLSYGCDCWVPKRMMRLPPDTYSAPPRIFCRHYEAGTAVMKRGKRG